ncbi:membrane protein, partial [Microbacterium sp. UCD-TDU]
GLQVVCTASYVLTQADVDSGSVSNTATATGTPPTGEPPVSPPSTTEIPVDPAPALTVVKSADVDELTAAGQTVEYSFLVTNTGNVTLTDVSVDETAFTGTGTAPVVACPAGAATLLPGAAVTCTASYVVTQADLDSGGVSNTATATGTPPSGEPPVSPPSTLEIPVDPAPALTVVKSADRDELSAAGQTIEYSFLVTNTGNVTLTDVSVAETAFTGTGTAPVVTCPADAASLAPGADVTCTASYVVTQADVDSGGVSNTATATGTPPSGEPPVSPPSTIEVPAERDPALTVVKSADLDELSAAGQTIEYSFLVTNTGNVTLTDVSVDETAFTGTGAAPVVTCPAGAASLAPGADVTCTASYVVTQADVDSGGVSNTATATGTPPSGEPPVSPPSTIEVPAEPAPALTVVKSADTTEISSAGQTIEYSFLVTNTGNVTLTDVSVDETAFTGTGTAPVVTCPAGAASLAPGADVTCTASYVVTQADLDSGGVSNTATATGTETAFTGTGTAPVVTCPAGAASLAPGADVTCTASYVVTQADLDSGGVSNTATATGTPPSGEPPVSPPSTTEVPVVPAPGITVVKSADTTEITSAGQTIAYSFLVSNTGNVTLTDVSVAETAFTGTGTAPVVTCPAGAASLAPGADVT